MTSLKAGFIDFLSAAPSSFHAAQAAGAMLSHAGFKQQQETETWDATAGGHFLIRDGALMAWFVPETVSKNSGFRIIGAHTDSPGFKLKFQPDIYAHGFNQANVEVYGGPILASWFDRELVLAGVVHLKDGVPLWFPPRRCCASRILLFIWIVALMTPCPLIVNASSCPFGRLGITANSWSILHTARTWILVRFSAMT